MKIDQEVQRLVDGFGNWCQGETIPNGRGGMARMTQELYPYTSIFSPVQVNRLKLKNRLVMAPMGNIDMCEETGRPNDKMIQYFITRAQGGVGLITTGLIPISHGVDHSVTELNGLSYFPRIDRSRTVYSGWRDLAQGVHNFGSNIFIQLTPGLGRVGNPECLVKQHKFPMSASMNPNFYIPQIPCMPLTDRAMKKIITNAGQAAADALACGLDGVYLHGHEGYLLEQITNPAFNRRSMGRYADWQRFGVDIVAELRKRTHPGFPIMYRIDLSLALNETYGEEGMKIPALKKFINGRLPDETLDFMENLVKAGVDIFDVDLGCYDNWWMPHPPSSMPSGCYLDVSERAKKHFAEKNVRSNAGLEVPIVAVGKLGYPDLAEQALRDGKCDMIMLGRPLLADAEWPNKAFAGKVSEIRPCIGCQEGCINEFVEGGHPQCAVNPRTGFEDVYTVQLPAVEKPKKIAVIGAGPAGVVTAVTAAQRGHQVTLFEKSDKIGGRMIAGCVAKIKYEVDNYRQYLERVIAQTSAEKDLTLNLNSAPDAQTLKEQGYDAIVVAVGSQLLTPKLAGLDQVPHIQAVDLFLDPAKMGDAKKIVVVGGGAVGCEAAYWLSYEYGREVKVVEMLPNFMEGVCTANRGHLIYYLRRNGVELLNCAKVSRFEPGKVIVARTKGELPDAYNTWQPILPKNIHNPFGKKLSTETEEVTLDCDLVVLALGGKPDDALFLELQRNVAAAKVVNIADSFSPRKILEAVRAGYALGRNL